MKRTILLGSLAIAIVAVLGLTAFSFANAKTGFDAPFAQEVDPRSNGETDLRGVLKPYFEKAVARILGMTVEELQEALAGGIRMSELIENAGLTPEEFKEAMAAALPGIVEQALEDGVITEEQARRILANGLQRRMDHRRDRDHKRGFGPLNDYVLEASAEILGMEVEELQAALQEGTPLEEIVNDAGLTVLEYRSALDAATPGIVDNALEDSAITDEQAEKILQYGLWPARCRDGQH